MEVPEPPIENEIEPFELGEPMVPMVPEPEDEETFEAVNEEEEDSNEIEDDLNGDYKVVW